MRIAIAAHSTARAGGVETYLADVVPALALAGHDVGCLFETAAGTAASILPARHGGPVWIADGQVTDALEALTAWRPDVIYLHGLRSTSLERQLTNIAPVVFFAHSYYGACISGEKVTRVPSPRACGRALGPACLAHYLPRRCGGLSPVTMLRQYGVQREKQRLLSEYAAVLVASRHMAREYASQRTDVRVVALPVSSDVGARSVPAGSTPTLLFLGRLEPSKGVDIALESAARAAALLDSSLRLVVGGTGTLADALRHRAERLMAANPRLSIELRGWMCDDQRRLALETANLLLMPSVWPEPFGLAGVEAAAAGVPAIAFHVGGIEDWLTDGVNGRLVPPHGDRVTAYSRAIAGTLRDPVALASMSAAASTTARRFSMTSHLQAIGAVFEAVQEARP